ncbi:MAG TPA: DUF2802 domain-containing protein [Gammaproteobacteria bacterium]|nr:DUF2802 domain-containing protein [Gammaproteobacteria bacterium]
MTGPPWMITLERMDTVTLILIVVVTAAFAAAVLAFVRTASVQRQMGSLAERLEQKEREISALSAGSVGQSQRIGRLEADFQRFRDRAEQMAASASHDGGDAVFAQAIRLARRGADAPQIMESCGLSQMEAELVVRLHRQSEAAE